MIHGDENVIPIAQLFYDDAGPHIIPRTTPAGGAPRHTPAAAAPRQTPATAAPRHTPAAGAPRHTPARGRELQDLLGTSILQLGGVAGGTRRTPTPVPAPVAIESLLYRGRAALLRALEIRAARAVGDALSEEIVEELLDLIALAAEE